jgi:hypothetical protein
MVVTSMQVSQMSEQAKYIGRHDYTSQNVMAICDFDMRFMFVVTGWHGSVHDTRVLQDTVITYGDRLLRLGHGPFDLESWTVRAAVEGTARRYTSSDWRCPDRR